MDRFLSLYYERRVPVSDSFTSSTSNVSGSNSPPTHSSNSSCCSWRGFRIASYPITHPANNVLSFERIPAHSTGESHPTLGIAYPRGGRQMPFEAMASQLGNSTIPVPGAPHEKIVSSGCASIECQRIAGAGHPHLRSSRVVFLSRLPLAGICAGGGPKGRLYRDPIDPTQSRSRRGARQRTLPATTMTANSSNDRLPGSGTASRAFMFSMGTPKWSMTEWAVSQISPPCVK